MINSLNVQATTETLLDQQMSTAKSTPVIAKQKNQNIMSMLQKRKTPETSNDN